MSSPLPVAHRLRVVWLVVALMLLPALHGCDYISSAMPPSPSPFPTLARLPSVTPLLPTLTPWPTPTLRPGPTPTPTIDPVDLEGTVAVGANLRTGPGTDFAIVTSVVAETSITLLGYAEGWYQVALPDDTEGWMSEQVIEIDPAIATAVPTVSPEE